MGARYQATPRGDPRGLTALSRPPSSASLRAFGQPADLCSPNLSVISDWPSFWQLFGLKPNTSDKFYRDENLAKGLFCQLRPFIPQLPSGAHGVPSAVWVSRMKRKNVRPSEVIPSTQERQILTRLNTCPERRRTCLEGLSPFSPPVVVR